MTKTQKRTLHIWISCGLLACGLFLSQSLLSGQISLFAYSTTNSTPDIIPMVIPVNEYRLTSPRTHTCNPVVSDELALEVVKGDSEEWEAQGTPQAIVTQLPTSYMTGSSTGLSSPKQKERMVRSVGGGQTFNASSITSVSPSMVAGNTLAQATISLPKPKMTTIRSRNTSNILEPFSDELPFADVQRAAPPGSGSSGAVGGVTPIGDCPWILFPLFFIYIYRRQRKAIA